MLLFGFYVYTNCEYYIRHLIVVFSSCVKKKIQLPIGQTPIIYYIFNFKWLLFINRYV